MLSPHRSSVAQVLSGPHKGPVQHTLQTFVSGLWFSVLCFTRVATVRMPSATESMPVSRRIFLKLELPLVRKLSFCVLFLDNATCSVFARSTEREVSYRCCLGSFLIAWVRRMSAKHFLELAIASPVCQLLHMVGPAPVSSKVVGVPDSRMSVRSLFFFLDLHSFSLSSALDVREATRTFHRFEHVSRVCCVLCLCRQTRLPKSSMF